MVMRVYLRYGVQMSADTSAASRKAINYAEVRLGVQDIFQEARTARNGLDECLTLLSEARDNKRSVEMAITDREMELLADERSKHADASDAWLGRHLKVVYHDDPLLAASRETLNGLTGDIEGYEFDKNMLETDIKIAVARMNELGGYLQYLATAVTVA